MAEVYTTGSWKPRDGHEEEFVAAWKEFAQWASAMDGAGRLRLTRDLREPDRFISFGGWESLDHVRAWKSSDEFGPRMAKLRAHVAEFEPGELEVVTALDAGAVVAT